MRILVIEDELSLLELITKRLSEEGYAVDPAANGKDAQDYINSVDYDCIILDLLIPLIDGLSLLRKIRVKRSHRLSLF